MSMHHDMRRPIAAMCVTAGAAPIGSGAGIVSSQIQTHKQHGGWGGTSHISPRRSRRVWLYYSIWRWAMNKGTLTFKSIT